MTAMTKEEWQAFLREKPRTAKVATVREDGRPHVAPVWIALDGDDIVFNTGETTVKGKSLRRDPRLSLCVDDEQPPFSFVIVEGRAELIDDLVEVRKWATVIGGRYMGADKAEQYGARNGVAGELLVRVKVERVIAEARVAD